MKQLALYHIDNVLGIAKGKETYINDSGRYGMG